MKTAKIQTAFRFDEELIKAIKEKAKADHRSLNNYIEDLLYKAASIPNAETIKAFDESNLETIDNLDEWLENL